MRILCVAFVLLSTMLTVPSCISQKKSLPNQYLESKTDTVVPDKIVVPEPVVQKGDMLSIIVFSTDAKASIPFNQPVVGAESSTVELSGSNITGGNVAQTVSGYLVDQEGNIQFPILGLLKVEGLTKNGIKKLLDSKLKDKYLTDPYYIIRFVNFKITVMGEVTRAGTFSIPAEKVNILEAIALAGEMTIWGRRDNVTLIRELNGKREVVQLNLTSSAVFNSPYYYLQQNDIVVVAEKKKKAAANDQIIQRNITIATSILSSIAIVITAINTLTK